MNIIKSTNQISSCKGGDAVTDMCIAAANHIIERINLFNEGKDFRQQVLMTSKRLQKILYFSDILYMLENNKKSMFKDEFYAWPSGPVIPYVYEEFMQYQNGAMRPHTEGKHSRLTPSMISALDRVIDATMTLDTSELIKTSHVEDGPWQSVFDETDYKLISKSKIYSFYDKKGAPYGAL